jgi:hypothetical protein
MGLVVKAGTSVPPVPEGVYQGVCYALYDLGTQFSEKWGKSAHQCLIVWELPECRLELEKDGKVIDVPRAVSKKYTMSLNEKAALRKDLQSWRGRNFSEEELSGFDITRLLGVNCMIQIIHNKKDSKVFANIASITPLYRGLEAAQPENPIVFFSMAEHRDIPETAPGWIKEMIEASAEWKGVHTEAPPEAAGDPEDVPF